MNSNFYKSNKKIMLIEPPFYRLYHDQYCLVKYPLALGYLSGSIINNTDWSVQTYNADFNVEKKNFIPGNDYITGEGFKRYLSSIKDPSLPIWNEIKNSIEVYNPSVLGITVKSQNFISATMVAKIAKKINPEIKIVVGGAHSTMNGSKVFECENIDFACVGEGENTIVELLNALEKNKELNAANGIMFKHNNKIINNKPRAYIEDLDSLAFPLANAPKVLKDFDKYPKEAFGYIFGSRGCPYACTFCESKAMWTRKVRYRSPENIVDEMKQMYHFGIDRVNFDDDTFGVSKKNIKAMNNLMNKELPNMTYTCETVVQLAKDENVVKDMKHGGCTGTFVGIESGNNEILKSIKKTQTTDECIQAMDNLRKHGIESHAFIMVGFPDETEETFKQTIDFIPKLNPDSVIFSIFTPYPGSDLYYQCKDSGIIGDDFDLALYNHQSPLNCFTKNIPKDRFYELRKNAVKFIDSYNSKAKFRRGIRSLRNIGIAATLKKVITHVYSGILNYKKYLNKFINKNLLIYSMKTKIFCDSADYKIIKKFSKDSLVKGFTTNPSLMRMCGAKNYKKYSIKILKVCGKKPVSIEVFGDNFEEMLKQANIINSWSRNVYVKIPVVNSLGHFSGKVIKKLSKKGVRLNITAVYTVNQVKKIIRNINKNSKVIISIFSGRMSDVGKDPIPIVKKSVILTKKLKNVEILWASTREAYNYLQAKQCNCSIITMPPSVIEKISKFGKTYQELTLDTVKKFLKDSKDSKFKI